MQCKGFINTQLSSHFRSDCTSQNSCTQLWLVTHFYENGSLYDYLNNVPLPGTVMVGSPEAAANKPSLFPWQAHNILLSSLNGLVHLHTEIFGTQVNIFYSFNGGKLYYVSLVSNITQLIASFSISIHFRVNQLLLTGISSRKTYWSERMEAASLLILGLPSCTFKGKHINSILF